MKFLITLTWNLQGYSIRLFIRSTGTAVKSSWAIKCITKKLNYNISETICFHNIHIYIHTHINIYIHSIDPECVRWLWFSFLVRFLFYKSFNILDCIVSMCRMHVNDKMRRIWQEALIAFLRYYPHVRLEWLRGTTKNLRIARVTANISTKHLQSTILSVTTRPACLIRLLVNEKIIKHIKIQNIQWVQNIILVVLWKRRLNQ
jgi:hypothetical protein